MEKINSKKELIEFLKDTRAVEIRARESYIEDIELFKFPEIKIVVEGIKQDEDEHIEMLEELIAMLETPNSPVNLQNKILKPLITSAIITLTIFILFLLIISGFYQDHNYIGADSIKNIINPEFRSFIEFGNFSNILMVFLGIFVFIFIISLIFYSLKSKKIN